MAKTAYNKRFGNRLAEGVIIGCSPLSAIVPADEQISAFCIYLRLLFSNRLWFRAGNYKMPAHRQALPLAARQNDHPIKMTYDFFASKSDKINLLDFLFKETDLKIFDLASPYGQEISEYKSTEEITSKFDLDNGGQSSQTFQLWTKRFGGDILFRKIDLNPKHCDGYSFRYSTDGWGLIHLYFGGQKDNVLFHSQIGHFNEKGALKWEDTNPFNGKVDKWNWKEIEQTSRKLKNQIHNKTAVRKIGSYGVLSGADTLSNDGIKLWGTQQP